jgi:hypothetical protein
MHRVYNSAFMNMLRDEQNAHYRSVIRNTIEFDPEILQRYVNFMSNPDEKTAVEQFGRGEKYFGICTLLATLPGLPMLGHGQLEGFEEQYGMEFRHARRVESADAGLVAEHWRRISPLLRRRHLFAGAHHFRLYDCVADAGGVNEDVFAFSNRHGDERALVLYHNRYAEARGSIHASAAFAEKCPDGSRPLRQTRLVEALGVDLDPRDVPFLRCRDLVGDREHLFRTADLAARGLRVELAGYGSRVLLDWREVREDGRPWNALCDALGGQGAVSLDERLLEHELGPVHRALVAVAEVLLPPGSHDDTAAPAGAGASLTPASLRAEFERRVLAFLDRAREFARSPGAPFAGLAPAESEIGDMAAAAAEAGSAVAALLRVPALATARSLATSADARAVLPLAPLPGVMAEGRDATPSHAGRPAGERDAGPWVTAVMWITARALGRAAGGPDPGAAAARLFDALRLRRGVHAALEGRGLGASDEDRWRRAALVRAALAHADWSLAGDLGTSAPWRHDRDVQWLIGVHESGGERWFRSEDHARVVWWFALPALLSAAASAARGSAALPAIEAWVAGNLAAAQATGWRFEALLDRLDPRGAPGPASTIRRDDREG